MSADRLLDRKESFVAELVHSALYSGIQSPLNGLVQIYSHETGKDYLPKVQLIDAPKPAKIGTSSWAAQQLGNAVGILPWFAGAKVGAEAIEAVASLAPAEMAVAESAVAGWGFGFVFQPADNCQGKDFWRSRWDNGLGSSVNLTAMTAFSLMFDASPRAAWGRVLSGMISGAGGGLLGTEANCLLSQGKLASKTELVDSLASMSLVGGVLNGCNRLKSRNLPLADRSLSSEDFVPQGSIVKSTNHQEILVGKPGHYLSPDEHLIKAGPIFHLGKLEVAYRPRDLRRQSESSRFFAKQAEANALKAGTLDVQVRDLTAQLDAGTTKMQTLDTKVKDLTEQLGRDELTGLSNGKAMMATLQREFNRATRFGRPLSLLMLDLDGFKAVNDQLGHSAGDTVLQEMSRQFSHYQRRATDTLCRPHGDEFVFILADTGQEEAEKLAAVIRNRTHYQAKNQEGTVSIAVKTSVGVVTFCPEEAGGSNFATVKDLLDHADQSMYIDKRQRKQVVSEPVTVSASR